MYLQQASSPPGGRLSPSESKPDKHYNIRWGHQKANLEKELSTCIPVTSPIEESTTDIKARKSTGCHSDVTVVCDGGKFEGHRLVLAASSPCFYRLLMTENQDLSHQNSHTYLILSDIECANMKLIMEYIYTGEVIIPNEVSERFWQIYKDLELRGPGSESLNSEFKDSVPEELTVNKKRKAEELTEENHCIPMNSVDHEHTIFPGESKYTNSSNSFTESLKEKLRSRSRSSTPVLQSNSPFVKYMKEENSPVKYEADDEHRNYHGNRPPMIPSTVHSPSLRFQTDPATFSYPRTKSPTPISPTSSYLPATLQNASNHLSKSRLDMHHSPYPFFSHQGAKQKQFRHYSEEDYYQRRPLTVSPPRIFDQSDLPLSSLSPPSKRNRMPAASFINTPVPSMVNPAAFQLSNIFLQSQSQIELLNKLTRPEVSPFYYILLMIFMRSFENVHVLEYIFYL